MTNSSAPAIEEPLDAVTQQQILEESGGSSENELFASIKWNNAPDINSNRFSSSHENSHISLGSRNSCNYI